MVLEFEGDVIWWKGPAPFIFVPTSREATEQIKEVANRISYGWGCISVMATIGDTRYKTSLFPKNGGYLVPIKVAVQKAERVDVGSLVAIRLDLEVD